MRAQLAVAAAIAACCPTPKRAATPVAVTPPVLDAPSEVAPTPPLPPLDWGAAGIDWSQPPPAWPTVPFTPPVPTEWKLANGIRVLLVENHRLPLVSVRIAVTSAGASADGAATGLAARTADLLDEGAGTRSALELPEELERLGASLTVGAGTDHARVTLDTLAETLPASLALAADVLQRPRLAADDWARIRAEALADLATRGDQPLAIGWLVFARAVYGPTHPYGAPVDGYTATVSKLSLDQVKRFYRTHYGPATTTIVVAGDVTAADARRLIDASFAGWKPVVKPLRAPRSSPPPPPKLVVVDRPGAPQSVVMIGRPGPNIADPALAANDVINTAVGGSFASRLNAELREQKGYTYGIGSAFLRNAWGGAWRVQSQIRSDVTVPAIKDALAIVASAGAAPLPATELAKAKSFIIGSLPQDFETNGAIANAYAALALEGRPLTYYRDLPAQIDAVTAEAAQAAAAAAWRDLSIVVVGDWSAIGRDLATLGLPIERVDADGAPVK